MNRTRIIHTMDGSHTLYREDLDETYHSKRGALTESLHVFIRNGLQYQLERNPQARAINILEVGFGTGLNAALTYRFAASAKYAVHYVALEPFPLGKEIIDKINYFEGDHEMRHFFQRMHGSPWNAPFETNGFILTKSKTRIQEFQHGISFDIVYFDAFAPEKQPDMWTPDVMKRIYQLTNAGGVLTTYCAQGAFRRNLIAAGFSVTRLPGPPGKREMIRGEKT